ncbi:MAG: TadE/TadG family type IV pilus assembly protein [Bryobacteraceae bacterium]
MRRRRGNALLEVALFLPILFTLLVGMVQIGRVTYTYHQIRKTLYTVARFSATQQAVNYCDPADAAVTAAKNFALTGTTDEAAESEVPGLTADLIAVRVERFVAETGELGECECSAVGCDAASGGQPPDFVVVSIPNGFEVPIRIPFLAVDPILLRPQVRVPFGGT